MSSYRPISAEDGGKGRAQECAREVTVSDTCPLDVLEDTAPEEIPATFRPDIEAPFRGIGRDAACFKASEAPAGSLRCRCRADWAWCGLFLCGLVVLLAGGLADSASKMLEQVEVRAELRAGLGGADSTTVSTASPTSRSSTRRTSTAAPAVATPAYFVTLSTESTPLVTKAGAPFEVFNLGMGRSWDGFKTKFEFLLPFLENRRESDLIAFMDGADVFWGGCDMEQFFRSYHEIVNRSKAPIVISAEIACFEQKCWKVPQVPSWADEMSHQNLGGGFWEDYVAPDGCRSTCCPCRKPPAVEFLNSGFMIGPMGDIRDMVKWSLEHYDEVSTLGDQSVLAHYWFHEGHSKITLDYAGELCLTMSDLKPFALFNLTQHGHIWNKAFGRKQCFIHGNGRSRGPMWDLLGSFAHSPYGKHYLKVFEKKEVNVTETEEEILPLTFFQDGVKLGPCAFQFYHSRAAQQLIQDIMDGYFPYELKQDYPDGVMLKVIDRVSQTFGAWKENASHDRDLAGIGDRLAVGKVLNGGDKVVRGGEICKVRDAARSGRARSCGPEKEVSLLVPTRPEKDPIAHVQVRIDQDHRAVFCLEVWQTVGDLEDAVEQWCSDEGLDGLRGGHLRTAFPPRSYVDREQSMSDAQLVPSATLFVATS